MDVDTTAEKIENMEIRGAGKIGRCAVHALKNNAKNGSWNSLEDYMTSFRSAYDKLLATRPTAISLYNALEFCRTRVGSAGTLEEALKATEESADLFTSRSLEAIVSIGRYASEKIPDNATILTHCNSTAALSAIVHAHEADKNIKVYSTETRPKQQGFITTRYLQDNEVPVTLIIDSAVTFIMNEVDMVIVGADTIESDGTLINKIGTSQIALVAKEFGVPVMVCAETYKFSPKDANIARQEIEVRPTDEIVESGKVDGAKIFNPVFDRTSPENLEFLACERGVIKFSDFSRINEILGE